ncbi:helix-turn-helix transcriptional regulator [Chlorogloeopsis fritschii PCC 9212]|uniref:AraC family transcriptional regulator n=1 Tax=Chlorogloeopsis fritschii PCC 6912 TaxID=211165 RepID=A0A3S0XPQ2_CHLFR|nr:AraC family transcriptional regulator [Chlorogloeopsis fritschii]RUR74837.1 AraC family transcriptional regulator [Chlorogloeopsis fritschii PCC 6912]
MSNTILQPDNTNPFPPVAESSILNAGNYFSENLIDYPHELAHGYIKDIKLHQGFLLTIRDYQNHETHITEISEAQEHPLQFYFRLRGYGISNIEYASVKAGQTALCGCGFSPRMLFNIPQPNQEIDIHIQPELFKTLFGIQDDAILAPLKHLFHQPDEEYYTHVGTITTQMQVSLQQIWQCPFQGLVKQIYLESKVLELIALRLQQDITGEAIQSHPDKPKRTVIERIYQAKELLESRMENPPSMMELAENVGLSPYQLKQGFQKVFGKSAFQYLHQYRMEQARLLLYEGNMRVADVANCVGYSHLGQFSAAFKRMFGISPRDCLKGKV